LRSIFSQAALSALQGTKQEKLLLFYVLTKGWRKKPFGKRLKIATAILAFPRLFSSRKKGLYSS